MRKILIALFAVVAINYIVFVSPSAAPSKFKVVGSKIYNSGKEFIIKGVNIAGPNWVWDREMTQDADLIAYCWKFNLVRVNSLLFVTNNPYKQFTVNNDTDKLVNAFTSRGLVVMFEAHDRTGSYYEGADLNALVQWYRNLARKYKDNPYVWFDVMNEPDSNYGRPGDRKKWNAVHQSVVKAIRVDAGANNIIAVEGTTWGQDAVQGTENVEIAHSALLSGWPKQVLQLGGKTYGNIIQSIHTYEVWNGADAKLKDYIRRVQDTNHIPLVIGEYGTNNFGKDSTAAVETLYNVVVPGKIGRIVWQWSGGDFNDLTTENYSGGSGWDVNSCSTPTNLSKLGQKVWADTRNVVNNTIVVNDNTKGTETNQIEYVGNWEHDNIYNSGGCGLRDLHVSNSKDNYAQIRFHGRQIEFFAGTDPGHGIVTVSIDGGPETEVDLYGTVRTCNQLVYTSPKLKDGKHTLKVRVTGRKNPRSSGTHVWVDRFNVHN